MVKKIFLRAGLLIAFMLASYLLDAYIKGKLDYKALAVSLFVYCEMFSIMIWKWKKF